MKTALSKTGETIEAGAGMPNSATCPLCGCDVSLRKRSRMGGGVTYFWRHGDSGSRPCPERSRPYLDRR